MNSEMIYSQIELPLPIADFQPLYWQTHCWAQLNQIMMQLFKDENQKENFVSTYQNPFHSDKVKQIEFTIEYSIWTKEIEYKSRVRFESGTTTGYHRIQAASFPQIVEQTEAFIRSL